MPKKDRSTEFMNMASHKMRTPLTAIIWFSEILLRGNMGELNEKQREYLEDIAMGSETIEQLLDNFLTVSRISRHKKFKLFYHSSDLIDLIKEVINKKLFRANSKNLKIVFAHHSPKKLFVEVDPDRFVQLFRIILDNAISYATPKGKISFEIKKGKKDVTIITRNKGIGIPKEDLEKVFKKAYRSQNAIQFMPDAQGLGLYIARKVLDKHQGKIWINSTVNGETSVFVTLPLKQPAVPLEKKQGKAK